MISNFKRNIQKDVKRLKHKYKILKIKWILLFVLPLLVVVLAYQVSKQFLKIKMNELHEEQSTGEAAGEGEAAGGSEAGRTLS